MSHHTITRLEAAVAAFVAEVAALAAEAAEQVQKPNGEWSVHDFLQRYGEILETAVEAFQDLAAEAGFSFDDSEDVLADIAGNPSAN